MNFVLQGGERACLLREFGVACSAFPEWMRGHCGCLEAGCLGRHEATRGYPTMC